MIRREVAGALWIPGWRTGLLCMLLLILTLTLREAVAQVFTDSQWAGVLSSIEAQYGARARLRVQAWRSVMDDSRGLEERQKLEQVNRFFNQLHFVDDDKLWAESDYWATPLEFLGANGGDCEDFSIAKYLTLVSLGVPQEKMRITYVKALTLNQFHMVVAYYPTPSSVPLILDNLDGEMRPATQRGDLVPVYSFNGQNLWLNKERGQGVLAGKATRLKRWNDLQSRHRVQRLRRPLVLLD